MVHSLATPVASARREAERRDQSRSGGNGLSQPHKREDQ
jgi:hypothetical protein